MLFRSELLNYIKSVSTGIRLTVYVLEERKYEIFYRQILTFAFNNSIEGNWSLYMNLDDPSDGEDQELFSTAQAQNQGWKNKKNIFKNFSTATLCWAKKTLKLHISIIIFQPRLESDQRMCRDRGRASA